LELLAKTTRLQARVHRVKPVRDSGLASGVEHHDLPARSAVAPPHFKALLVRRLIVERPSVAPGANTNHGQTEDRGAGVEEPAEGHEEVQGTAAVVFLMAKRGDGINDDQIAGVVDDHFNEFKLDQLLPFDRRGDRQERPRVKANSATEIEGPGAGGPEGTALLGDDGGFSRVDGGAPHGAAEDAVAQQHGQEVLPAFHMLVSKVMLRRASNPSQIHSTGLVSWAMSESSQRQSKRGPSVTEHLGQELLGKDGVSVCRSDKNV
jgi:hypothetical protein